MKDRGVLALTGIAALAALPGIWAAFADQGLFWPDEIYQSLEQAHRLAFGYGLIPWEFEKGARSWLFPGVIGIFWKLCAGLGVSQSMTLVILAKLLMVAAALTGLWISMRFASSVAGLPAALATGILSAAFPMSLVYGSRCMTEVASGPLLVAAVWRALDPRRSAEGRAQLKDLRLAGALAAAAVFLRYQNGVVLLMVMAILAYRRRFPELMAFTQVAALGGVMGGALDAFTWGTPFGSFIQYVKFNLVEGKASQWGTADAFYYFRYLWSATGPAGLLIALGLASAAKTPRGRELLAITAVYLFLHILIPHKELRFLLPAVPLALVASGIGLARLFEKKPSAAWAPAALALLAVPAMGYAASRETFDSMGQYTDQPTRHGGISPWHDYEGFNRLMAVAGNRSDLCGAILLGVHPAWTGGYSYLHRDVPLFFFQPSNAAVQQANYAIGPSGLKLTPYEPVASEQGYSLYRRDGDCIPPATRNYILP